MRELANLTGWDVSRYREYPSYFQGYRAPQPPDGKTGSIHQENKNQKTKPFRPQPTHLVPSENDPIGSNDVKLPDSIAAISQDDFVMQDESEPGEKKDLSYGFVALAAITGLFLMHRKKQ